MKLSLVLVLASCTAALPALDDAGASADALVAADGGAEAGARTDALVASCDPRELSSCEYRSPIHATAGAERTHVVRYTDAAGLERTIEIQVRLAADQTAAQPVVVWSHGGAGGMSSANGVGREWSEQLTSAGYAVVAIAHRGRNSAEYLAIAGAAGISTTSAACATDADCSSLGDEVSCVDGGCRIWKHLSWDRPHDVRAVLDFIVRESGRGGTYSGQINPARIVYAGHSAGAGSAMMIAGATRQFGGEDVLLIDGRPMAFISASPQGPGDEDFTEGSFTGARCVELAPNPSLCLTRPHLTLTGIGDDAGAAGENRRLSFDLAPATGSRYLAFIGEEAARHTTFDYGVDACMRYTSDQMLGTARCSTYLIWLRSVTLAFLDAVARDLPEARAWLGSRNADLLSGAAMSFERR